MRFGAAPLTRLPRQDSDKILVMADRFARTLPGHNAWAENAKVCVDFFEGRQWTDIERMLMTSQNRRPFVFNIIAPLVRLILGYQSQNKSDIVFKPGNDTLSSEEVAQVLTHVEKSVAIMNKLPFVDTTVFMDGVLTGRGFYRTTLDFQDNDFGETRTRALDPFTTYIDPDADTYNLDESAGFIQIAKWVSLDEIEGTYGKMARNQLSGFAIGSTPIAPLSTMYDDGEIGPVRTFGAREDMGTRFWDNFYARMGDFYDPYRKTLRILETEHYVSEERWVAIDLETGDKKVLPATMTNDDVQKMQLWGEVTGNPLQIQKRMVRTPHWTTTCADMILHDKESPYATFSITPYFPYFRRGATRSPIADMIDPQLEKNKRRTAEIETVARTASGGWKVKKGSLNPREMLRLKKFGSTPGFVLEYMDEAPEQITPAAPAMAHERLEQKADEDIRRISGINEAALGESSAERSGRAIEAKQRQAVISLQVYLDNFRQSKELLGQKRLELYQRYYSERRIYRILGEDGKLVAKEINVRQAGGPPGAAAQIANDITIGKYACVIDEQPLSATFASAQYEEQQALLEKLIPFIGPALPAFADLIFESSSFPNKAEWVERMRQVGLTPPMAPPGVAIDPTTGQPIMGAPPAVGAPQPPGGEPVPMLAPPGAAPAPAQPAGMVPA